MKPSDSYRKNPSIHISYESSGIGQYDHTFREKVLFKTVRSAFAGKGPAGVKILDMGCGRGELLRMLKEEGFQVVGMDMDPNCVRIAGQHAPTVQGDYSQVGERFLPGEFDMVISSHSLEHLENPKRDLINLVRFSKQFVLIAVPNPLALPNVVYEGLLRRVSGVNLGHHYIWDHRHLKNFLENHANLRVISWTGDFIRLFPRKMGIRKWLRGTGLVYGIEYSISRLFPFFCDSIIALCKKNAHEGIPMDFVNQIPGNS